MGYLFRSKSCGKKAVNTGGDGGAGHAGCSNGSGRGRRLSGAHMLVIGILIGALVFGGGVALAGPAFMAAPSSSKVFIDGDEIFAEAYMIEDANYFKLRDIARALDVGVWYDEYRDNVYIETDIEYDPLYTGVRETTKQTQVQQLASLTPMQKSLPVDVNNIKQYDTGASETLNYSATITIIELIRGEEAASIVKSANVHNPSAGFGKEYILALVRAKITDTANKNFIWLSDIRTNMHCYSTDGVLYPQSNPLNINPLNEQPKEVGETVEGWIAFAVDRNDPEPRVQIGNVADTGEPAWFALFD